VVAGILSDYRDAERSQTEEVADPIKIAEKGAARLSPDE
jgi:hypothetical protein